MLVQVFLASPGEVVGGQIDDNAMSALASGATALVMEIEKGQSFDPGRYVIPVTNIGYVRVGHGDLETP
jgi:hypothetical protein